MNVNTQTTFIQKVKYENGLHVSLEYLYTRNNLMVSLAIRALRYVHLLLVIALDEFGVIIRMGKVHLVTLDSDGCTRVCYSQSIDTYQQKNERTKKINIEISTTVLTDRHFVHLYLKKEQIRSRKSSF